MTGYTLLPVLWKCTKLLFFEVLKKGWISALIGYRTWKLNWSYKDLTLLDSLPVGQEGRIQPQKTATPWARGC